MACQPVLQKKIVNILNLTFIKNECDFKLNFFLLFEI